MVDSLGVVYLMINIIEQAMQHAKDELPRECCGVVVNNQYIRCTNTSTNEENFIIDPLDYAKAEDLGEIQYIVHSHTTTKPVASQADLVGIERSQIPWIIVNPKTNTHTVTNPTGYTAPLVGREFCPVLLDCYTLIIDYYREKLGIVLPDFDRRDRWWDTASSSLYVDNYVEAGFTKVHDIKEHDVIVMSSRSKVPNHAGIYVGNTKILHHLQGKFSSYDVYGDYWRQRTWGILRHKDLI